MGSDALTGPVAQDVSAQNTFAQYDVARGKPVLHEVGEELGTQSFEFFFSEEFCDPEAELARLKHAFSTKTPLPLLTKLGVFSGVRYVVEGLEVSVKKTTASGRIVRLDATITLIEAPVNSLLGLATRLAQAVAPGLVGAVNPNIRR